MRYALLWFVLLLVVVGCLGAADHLLLSKPAAQWSEDDARLILTRSPWTRVFRAGITRRLTEDQLREGGQMGQPRGVGNEGVDPKGSGPVLQANIFSGPGGDDRSVRSLPRGITLQLRWESALPVRLAELKAHEPEPPTLEGDGYRIAVYGVPNGNFQGDPEKLGAPLKNMAALKREGKKDVRPIRVEVFQRESDLVVVYLFPLSAEITLQDRLIEFDALIGRIVVSQTFDLNEMQFLGRLEL